MRKWFACLLILLAAASLATLAFAQMRGGARRDGSASEALRAKREASARGDERLRRLLSAAGVGLDESSLAPAGGAFRGLKISWQTPGQKGSSASPLRAEHLSQSVASAVVSERRGAGGVPRERSLELSPEHVFVATVDAKSRLRWWSVMPDPRVLRSEGPKAEGDDELTGLRLFRPEAEFFVNLPDDAEAAELRFYHPLAEGGEFRLQLLGAVSLRRD